MENRDLKADRELCNKATCGPWATDVGNIFSEKSLIAVMCVVDNFGQPEKKWMEDAEFIAQAREGWLHAIERALKAEALVRELVETLQMAQEQLHENGIGIVDDREVMDKAKEVLGDGS